MTATALPRSKKPNGRFDLGPFARWVVGAAGIALTLLCAVALARGLTGMAPMPPQARDLAVMIHLATVIPAVPLGTWLLLARKGTPRHKALGKLWLAMMVATAVSAVFIRFLNHGQFSLIHLFVPLTLAGAWRAVSAARRGDIAAHKRIILGLFLGALVIAGGFTFLPGRVMGVWLFG